MFRFPPKLTVAAAGETIEYVAAGDGAATVVLVNGSGGPVEGWHKVFEPIAGFARVFAYNRPGIGGSARPQAPQTGLHMARALRAALHAAGMPAPYVLAGHSLGGLVVNLFARLYPAEVAAVVLIEASAPEDVEVLARHENGVQRFIRTLAEKLAPPEPNAEVRHVRTTVCELAAAPPFPPVPLTVITGGKPAMAWATPAAALAARARHQQALAGLSPLGRQVIAADSGHFPQFTEPGLVVAAIAEVAEAASRRAASGEVIDRVIDRTCR